CRCRIQARLLPIPGPADPAEWSVSVSGIALGDPVIATFLEFLLQDRECGPVGLVSFAVDLHCTVVRPGERILRFLAGAPQRGRQFITVTAVPTGLQHHASCSRVRQRSLPRPPSLSVMLPGSMPYLESIPACWALSVSTLSGSSLLAWLAWSSLPWLRSSCRIWSLSIFICGLLSISSMCPERLAGPASAGSRQRGLAGGAGGADVRVVDLLLAEGLADL